jgi:hypothetical protein
MAEFDALKGAESSEFLAAPSVAHTGAETSGQILPLGLAARFVFSAPAGSVVSLSGIDVAALRELVDKTEEIPLDRRALFLRFQPTATVEAYVEQAIATLAETAVRLWPIRFTDLNFAMCGDDTLGRRAAGVIAREMTVAQGQVRG